MWKGIQMNKSNKGKTTSWEKRLIRLAVNRGELEDNRDPDRRMIVMFRYLESFIKEEIAQAHKDGVNDGIELDQIAEARCEEAIEQEIAQAKKEERERACRIIQEEAKEITPVIVNKTSSEWREAQALMFKDGVNEGIRSLKKSTLTKIKGGRDE